ncbi:hypothetical protein BDW62DRAFT_204546 [Aspergillus aurantiobrunneus]
MNTAAEVEATGTIDPRLLMKGAEVSAGPQPSMANAQSDSVPSPGIKAQSQRKTKSGVTFTDSITADTFAARKKPHPLSNVCSANSPETPKPTTALPKGQFANAPGVGSLTASAPPPQTPAAAPIHLATPGATPIPHTPRAPHFQRPPPAPTAAAAPPNTPVQSSVYDPTQAPKGDTAASPNARVQDLTIQLRQLRTSYLTKTNDLANCTQKLRHREQRLAFANKEIGKLKTRLADVHCMNSQAMKEKLRQLEALVNEKNRYINVCEMRMAKLEKADFGKDNSMIQWKTAPPSADSTLPNQAKHNPDIAEVPDITDLNLSDVVISSNMEWTEFGALFLSDVQSLKGWAGQINTTTYDLNAQSATALAYLNGFMGEPAEAGISTCITNTSSNADGFPSQYQTASAAGTGDPTLQPGNRESHSERVPEGLEEIIRKAAADQESPVNVDSLIEELLDVPTHAQPASEAEALRTRIGHMEAVQAETSKTIRVQNERLRQFQLAYEEAMEHIDTARMKIKRLEIQMINQDSESYRQLAFVTIQRMERILQIKDSDAEYQRKQVVQFEELIDQKNKELADIRQRLSEYEAIARYMQGKK